MKVYEGKRVDGHCTVTVNGQPLNPRFDLRQHSPDGFNWGYGGSGPAQLALAMLADFNSEPPSPRMYQSFKEKVIANLDDDEWTLSDHVLYLWMETYRGLFPEEEHA